MMLLALVAVAAVTAAGVARGACTPNAFVGGSAVDSGECMKDSAENKAACDARGGVFQAAADAFGCEDWATQRCCSKKASVWATPTGSGTAGGGAGGGGGGATMAPVQAKQCDAKAIRDGTLRKIMCGGLGSLLNGPLERIAMLPPALAGAIGPCSDMCKILACTALGLGCQQEYAAIVSDLGACSTADRFTSCDSVSPLGATPRGQATCERVRNLLYSPPVQGKPLSNLRLCADPVSALSGILNTRAMQQQQQQQQQGGGGGGLGGLGGLLGGIGGLLGGDSDAGRILQILGPVLSGGVGDGQVLAQVLPVLAAEFDLGDLDLPALNPCGEACDGGECALKFLGCGGTPEQAAFDAQLARLKAAANGGAGCAPEDDKVDCPLDTDRCSGVVCPPPVVTPDNCRAADGKRVERKAVVVTNEDECCPVCADVCSAHACTTRVPTSCPDGQVLTPADRTLIPAFPSTVPDAACCATCQTPPPCTPADEAACGAPPSCGVADEPVVGGDPDPARRCCAACVSRCRNAECDAAMMATARAACESKQGAVWITTFPDCCGRCDESGVPTGPTVDPDLSRGGNTPAAAAKSEGDGWPWWYWLLIVLGVLCVCCLLLALVFVVMRRRDDDDNEYDQRASASAVHMSQYGTRSSYGAASGGAAAFGAGAAGARNSRQYRSSRAGSRARAGSGRRSRGYTGGSGGGGGPPMLDTQQYGTTGLARPGGMYGAGGDGGYAAPTAQTYGAPAAAGGDYGQAYPSTNTYGSAGSIPAPIANPQEYAQY